MVDYSKWKDIEISDDEDETHPNIDTPSLFRWRHRARVERMEEKRKEADEIEIEKTKNIKQQKEIEQELANVKNQQTSSDDVEKLTQTLAQLRKEGDTIKTRDEEFKKQERLTPWNVDTISQQGFEKTIINKKLPRTIDNLSDTEKETKMKQFFKKYEKEMEHYGMLKRYDDSRKYLKENPHLACEETANYLVIWCINLQMEEKYNLMEHVAHQTICMQYILELAKQLEYDPRSCIDAFFAKIQIAEPQYKQCFDDELNQFKERVTKRAAEKLDDALKEMEEEDKQKRLGPGGLDPVEVFESLPQELKTCFETRNIQMLQTVIAAMDEQDAKDYMKRCVDSGLWVPYANKKSSEDGDKNTDEAQN